MAGRVSRQPPVIRATLLATANPSQGESQFLTTPALAKPLNFGNLSLNDSEFDEDVGRGPKDSDTRLMEMLAAQAAHLSGPEHDEEAVANDEKLSDSEKKDLLQKTLNMAASNGDVEKVQKLVTGSAKSFIDVNASDEDGTPPLIYASCFVSLTWFPTGRNRWAVLTHEIGSRNRRASSHRCWS